MDTKAYKIKNLDTNAKPKSSYYELSEMSDIRALYQKAGIKELRPQRNMIKRGG